MASSYCVLTVRAWVEDHPAPFRAAVTTWPAEPGDDVECFYCSVDEVCDAVRAWLEARLAPRTPEPP